MSVIQAELEKLQKELESRVSVYEQLSAESKVLLHEKIVSTLSTILLVDL